MPATELVALVRRAGVVGAGGAGFPTHVKLGARVDTFIVNGAECEPLLHVDKQLAATQAERLVATVKTIAAQLQATRMIVALKEKYTEASSALRAAIGNDPITIAPLDDFYPAGDEHVLVYEVTGRVVPQGGIPLAVGVVVNNVQTILNVAGAAEGGPVTHKVITIGGAVRAPLTVSVPVGTLSTDALELAGGPVPDDWVALESGPMMGTLRGSEAFPVTKTTGGIIALPREHPLVARRSASKPWMLARARSVCTQCSYCTEFCPRNLLGHVIQPHLVMRHAAWKLAGEDRASPESPYCSECGVCEAYACPMDLNPRRITVENKTALLSGGYKLTAEGQQEPLATREGRQVPLKRLISRLGLSEYDRAAPLKELDFSPARVRIPLRQHLGAPATPVVRAGQSVRCGDVIGELPEKALGARVHASIDGVVREVTDYIAISR